MQILERIRARAAADPKHIVLPEGEDDRTIVAASLCSAQGIARITLLGGEESIRRRAAAINVDLTGVSLIDHKRARERDKYAAAYHELRRAKGVTPDEARRQIE